MRILNVYKGLNKDMYILALYRLISGMGYFVIPYLSLFLTNELTISVIVAGSIVAGANFLCIQSCGAIRKNRFKYSDYNSLKECYENSYFRRIRTIEDHLDEEKELTYFNI